MNTSRVVETFLDLVRIDSPSYEEAACARFCEEELVKAGCTVRFDDSAETTGSNIGNLIAELPGTSDAVLVLSAHMDTVEPGRGIEPVIFEDVIVSATDTVLGADDKAGIAAAIECVRRLAESDEARPNVRCVFTVQEEIGLRGAKALVEDDVRGDICLVLDADGEPGGIVIGAPTHYTFTAEFLGRAAHAGVAPEKGISAIVMAADAITSIPIGRLDEQTTANIGSISGGSATNVIAAAVTLTGECRSRDRERVELVRSQMDTAMREAAAKHGGSVEITWNLEYEGFALSEDDTVVRAVSAGVADAGLAPSVFATGGGSDANIIAALGVPTVALACGMQGVHSTSEQIKVSSLEALTDICVAVARRLAEGE